MPKLPWTRRCIGAYDEGEPEPMDLVQFVGLWLQEDPELLFRHIAFGAVPIWSTCQVVAASSAIDTNFINR